ncbi:MAG: porin family protein [Bacteroidota bacterium]|nr:porin family protein [Bacteroidota bacterium]
MKKLFIFFAMSLICLDVWSQAKLKTQCKFGFKAGSGTQTVTGCPVKTKPRIALMAGMWVQIKISKSWTMQSELYEIAKGTGGEHQYPPRYGDYRLQLLYVEVPILFQYNKKKVYFEFGPGLAALINSGEYTKGGAFPYQAGLYPFNKKEFSFNLGTGYVFNEKWFVGLRLSHSLLPVRKQLPEISHQVYNRGIVLAVSRQISFKASGTRQSQVIE